MSRKSKFKLKRINEVGGYLVLFGSILSAGYAGGSWYESISCEREKLDITEIYQEKIFEFRQECSNVKIDEIQRKTNALEISVKELKKMRGEN